MMGYFFVGFLVGVGIGSLFGYAACTYKYSQRNRNRTDRALKAAPLAELEQANELPAVTIESIIAHATDESLLPRNRLQGVIARLHQLRKSAAPAARLTKPAQVGNTIFGVGVDERMVIERAQREHEYMQTPEKEEARIASSNGFFLGLNAQVVLAELVELKGIRDELDGAKLRGEEWNAKNDDYLRRKPLAWERARDLLAGRGVSATARTTEKPEMLDDGFGNHWPLCRADCALQIVRPGKVQCEAEDCPHRTDNPSYYP